MRLTVIVVVVVVVVVVVIVVVVVVVVVVVRCHITQFIGEMSGLLIFLIEIQVFDVVYLAYQTMQSYEWLVF